jgi:hypothetical protein
MKKGQRASSKMFAGNKKTCIDCFHCKVSRKSIITNELCFAPKKSEKAKKRQNTGKTKMSVVCLKTPAHK